MSGRALLITALLLAGSAQAQPVTNCPVTFDASGDTIIGPGASAGFLRWQTSPGCRWAVSSGVDWFSFSQNIPYSQGYLIDGEDNQGLAAGMGSGVLPFLVTANDSSSQRSVTLQFVGDFAASFTITQEAQSSSRPSITSFTPSEDSSFSQTFALQIFDASGYRNVAGADLVFDTFPATGACDVHFYQAAGQDYLTLLNDGGDSYLPGLPFPGDGVVANSRCQVSAATSTLLGSGNNATLSIALTFLPAFAGNKLVFATATGAANTISPLTEVGQWTVGPGNSLHVSLPNPMYFVYSPGDQINGQAGSAVSDTSAAITAQTSTDSGGPWLHATVFPPNSPFSVTANPAALAPGTYTGQLAISAPGAQTVNVPISMTIVPPPALMASPAGVFLQLPFFCPSPPPTTVAITSSAGAVPVSLSISGSPNITAALNQSVTPAVLLITVNTTGLGAGFVLVSAGIIISSPGQENITIPVTVQLTFPPPPIVRLGPVAITLGVTPNNTQSQTVPVNVYACVGTPPFTISFATNPPGTWLSASAADLMAGPNFDTINLTVTANANGLSPGDYFGSVSVSSGVAASEGVTLTVYAPPPLTATPASLVFSHQIQVTNPVSQQIQVATSGAPGSMSALPFTVSVSQGSNTAQCGANWLSATPASGKTTGTTTAVPVTVAYNAAGLVNGAYLCSGAVTIAIPGTTIAPMSVPVTLGVTGFTAFFTSEVSLGGGVYYLQFPNGNLFGYYNLQSFPVLYHYDLGFESFIDAHDVNLGGFLYDFASTHWLYTSPSLYPTLYDFTLSAWIYYFPNANNPGHYTANPRYFANLTSQKIFTM